MAIRPENLVALDFVWTKIKLTQGVLGATKNRMTA